MNIVRVKKKMKLKYSKTLLPKDSSLANSFDRIDYSDAYQIKFASDKSITLAQLATNFMLLVPTWIRLLFNIRDKLMRPFGLKEINLKKVTHKLKSQDFKIGDHIGIFKLLKNNNTEFMVGESDIHLDFRSSFILKENGTSFTLILKTIVKYNTRYGKLYFSVIKPFHQQIVKSLLKRTVYQTR